MALELNQIYQGTSQVLLREIAADSVACAVWSPPYHVGKNYEEGQSLEDWLGMLREVVQEHYRLLTPGGFMVVNIADILAFPDASMPRIQATSKHRSPITAQMVLDAKTAYPEMNRYQLAEHLGCSEQTVDRRLNGNNIRGGKYASQTRVYLSGAQIERIAYEAGLYLYDRRIWHKDAAWENSKWHSVSYRAVDEFEYLYIFWKPGETQVKRSRLTKQEWTTWGSRAVWRIPSVRSNRDHEAKYPIDLPRRVIRLLSDPGDVILDCFLGSGTTAVAAIQEDRQFIGIEMVEKYVRLARRNIAEAQLKRNEHHEVS